MYLFFVSFAVQLIYIRIRGGKIMKKRVLSLFALSTLTLTLQAYDDTERKSDMQVMETSMAQIQKGILYNNKKMVIQGVTNLKQTAKNVEIVQKSVMDYSPKFARQQATDILKLADEIQKKMDTGHKHSAATIYTKVLDKCITCHNKIRKWNQ